MFAALYARSLAEKARFALREAQAKREARQYAEFADAIRRSGSMHGAPADPEAFG